MDGDSVSVLFYRRLKPQGKVRRRLQDLRSPSASSVDFIAGGHRLDLSHNESSRMAVDSLLSRGLKEYHQVLHAEGEVDFLSQPEKMYIMENGRDGITAGSSTSDDQLESSLADSEFGTHCPALSTDSDPTVTGDLSCQRGVSKCVLMKPSYEVYFQSHCGAASMKDLIREFLRKATEALVIVVDSFSDVELLCDLLEASRKRNVSIHLLLDHLNLSLFVSMWQELKLNSKNFPKLSVRSVQGQTYCAKTGRTLTGQITESFIITDWTEVLTGCYSFSWLSWQVHRSLAVLVKGSAVLPFHTEFLRLNSSSQTVPGFVSFIAVPHAIPFSNKTPHAPRNGDNFASHAKSVPSNLSRAEDKRAEAKAKVLFFSSLPSNRSKETTHPADVTVSPKPPHVVSAGKSETAGGAVYICHGSQRNGEPLGDSRNHVQTHLRPLSPTLVSHVESQLSGLTVSPAAQKTFPPQRRCRTVPHRTADPHQDYSSVRVRGLFSQQDEKDRSVKPLGTAVHQKNKHQWFNTQSLRRKPDSPSPCPKSPSSYTPQMKDLKKNLLLPLIRPGGLRCGLLGRKDHQPHLQSPPSTQPSTSTVPAPHLKAQLSPGAKPNQEAPLTLNWKSKSHAAKPELGSRHSFLSSLYRPVWRPFHSSGSVSLRRSMSFPQTQPSSFPKTVLLTDASKS